MASIKYIFSIIFLILIAQEPINAQTLNKSTHKRINELLKNNQLEKAKKIIDSLDQVQVSFSDNIIKSEFYRLKGVYFKKKFILDSAIFYYEKGWDIAKKINYDKYFYNHLRTLAYYYWESGRYSKSLEYTHEILRNLEKVKKSKRASLYNILGLTYRELGSYSLSEQYFQKAIKITRQTKNYHYQGIIYANMGMLYHNKGNIEKSLAFYRKGSQLEIENKDFRAAGRSFADIGKIYIQQDYLDTALKYLQQAQTYNGKAKDEIGLSRTYLSLGELYQQKEKPKKAEKFFQEAVKLAKNSNTQKELMQGHLGLYEVYSKTGNYKKANENLYDYFVMYKDLFNVQKIVEIENLQHKLNLQQEKTKSQKAQIKKQKTINKLLYVIIILSVLTAIGFLILLIRSRKHRKRLKKKNEEIERQKLNLVYLNKELRKAKMQAENSEALKDQFLRNISHEIRTPLNGIIGFSSIMAQTDISQEERINYQGIVEQNAKTLLKTIEEIIDIAKIKTHQISVLKDKFDLNSLINELHKLIYFEKKYLKKNDLNVIIDPQTKGEQYIYSDQRKIRKILIVLANNAIKFTEKGYIKLGYSINNGKVTFYIEDTGIGIPEEHRQKIYNSFSQADSGMDRNYQGVGLGLTIAKAFVEILKGDIWFDSCVDEGTTFYFSIPLQN